MTYRSPLTPSVVGVVVALAASVAACNDARDPLAPSISPVVSSVRAQKIPGNEPPAPSGMVSLTLAGEQFDLWPFTGYNFSGSPQDPINLIFLGESDPRQIRADLMSLSGTRGGPLASFGCTWDDAVGDPQANYAVGDGWVGSAIQLECGDFYGPRFHLRMFRQGNVTVANAHYEILIPGTNTHEVLSWELAEALVTYDIARTGLLGAAPGSSGSITPSPYFRAVQAPVVAFLASAQIAALGLSVNGDGTASIPNDGNASVLTLAGEVPLTKEFDDKDFVIQFGQLIPKPFCVAGTTGYLYASGPITVHMHSGIEGQNYKGEWTGTGTLTLVQLNPITHQPVGTPYQGVVNVRNATEVTNGKSAVDFRSDQSEVPDVDATRGRRVEHLRVREEGKDEYKLDISC